MNKNLNGSQIAVVVLFAIAVVYLAGNIPRLEVTWGGTVLSLSNIVVQSTSPYWQEKTMMGQVSMNGNSQYIWGQSGGSENVAGGVNALVAPSYTSSQDLKIDFNMPIALLRYNSQNTGQSFAKTQIKEDPSKSVVYQCAITRTHTSTECIYGNQFSYELCGDLFNEALSPARQYDAGCKAIGGIPVTCNPGDIRSRKCVFVEPKTVAYVYSLGSPDREWQVKLSMTTAGKSETVTISNDDPTAIGTNVAVQFVGGMLSNTGIPEGSSAWLLSSIQGGTMSPTLKIIAKPPSGVPALKTASYWAGFSSPTNGEAISIEALATAVNVENAKVDAIVNTAPPNGFAQTQRPVSLSLNSVVIDASTQPYFYPSFTFYTKAAWLGIGIPATKPTVLAVNAPLSLKSGEQGSITATVKNDGTLGAIDAKLTCDTVQTTSGNPYRLTIGTGQSGTAYWNVQGNVLTEKSVSCCVVANDVNDPRVTSGSPVCRTITLQAVPQPVCGDGVCTPPGETTATCAADCKSGVTYCVDGTANGKCSVSKPFFCTNGNLVAQAATCGCTAPLVAQPDGNCASPGTTTPGGFDSNLLTYGLLVVGVIVIVVALTMNRKKK